MMASAGFVEGYGREVEKERVNQLVLALSRLRSKNEQERGRTLSYLEGIIHQDLSQVPQGNIKKLKEALISAQRDFQEDSSETAVKICRAASTLLTKITVTRELP